MNQQATRVAVDQFGKEHWSLLDYVQSCCKNGTKGLGTLDLRKLRTNENTHPLLAVNGTRWQPTWGTRLQGYFKENDPALRLDNHDDWDCLDDLEAAGFVEVLTMVNGGVKMTSAGNEVAGRLSTFKANGGYYANFDPKAGLPAGGNE